MSAQTGSEPPGAPASRRVIDRARFRVLRWEKEPNPIWIRELKQAARLARTPIVLCVVAILVTLLIASIGGTLSTSSSPAETGAVLYQVFFSVAWFVATLVGPAVAANSIASEREGRTWEAVLLTGLRPGVVARGKLLAAYTAIGMYIVMLAPVGALPFLFGGVTWTEVLIAFVLLFFIALLSVAFGLAISSKMESLRSAILLTLLLAFPLSVGAFLAFGVGLSYAAHEAWAGVQEGMPVWLPTAYDRAPFGLRYALFLVVLPFVAVALPAWFLHEVTVANLTHESDDRTSGLKRWLVVATLLVTLAVATPLVVVDRGDFAPTVAVGLGALSLYLAFCVFLFAGDPVGPSRRVRIQWARAGASRVRRFFGPGVMRSAGLLLALGLGAEASLAALGLVLVDLFPSPRPATQAAEITHFAAYSMGFFTFVVGAGAFLRARAPTPLHARMVLFAVLFGAAVGPWIIAAVSGIAADMGSGSGGDALIVAAPSPFFAIGVLNAIHDGESPELIAAGAVCASLWAVIGLVMLGAARRRCEGITRAHDEAAAAAERVLEAEDRAAEQAARAGVEQGAGAVDSQASQSP